MAKRFESGLLFGGDFFSEQWHHLPRVSLCCGYQTSPSSAWNASLLWGSGCDLTTASVITCCDCQISAPEIRALRPAPKQTQWRGGGGGGGCARRGLLSATLHKAATASTRLIGLKSSAPPLLQREHEEPNAWQDNCEVILTARDAMRVGSLLCKRWPARRQLNMLPSKVVNYRGDIDVERPFWPGDLNPLAISLFCFRLLKAL